MKQRKSKQFSALFRSIRNALRSWWQRRCEERERNQKFTVNDFIAQIRQVRPLSSMSKLACLIPGLREIAGQMDITEAEEQMYRMECIYNSMAAEEREFPDILNGSRRRRIADGAGARTIEVNRFMRQFFMTRDMMHQVGGMNINGKINLLKRFFRGDRM